MTALITLFTLAFVLLGIAIVLYGLTRKYRQQRDEARKESFDIQNDMVEQARKMVAISGLDKAELLEAVAEIQQVRKVESSAWKTELPYGYWHPFPDPDGDPPPRIRGFWYEAKGKIIGVKMPTGSKFITHDHPWPETLIGMAGEVEVIVGKDTYTMGPGDVIQIDASCPHAVLRAKEPAEFTCIWGIPAIR